MRFSAIIIITLAFVISFPLAYSELQDDRDIFIGKAQKAFDGKNFEDAIFFLDKILEIESDHVEALHNKGLVLIKMGQIEEGMEYFDRVLAIEPNDVLALGSTADELVKLGKPQEASPYYERILEIEPNHISALSHKADQLVMLEKPNEAMRFYEKIIQIEPHGKDPLGIFFVDKILAIMPNHIDALNKKGTSQIQLGRTIEGHTLIFEDRIDDAISLFDKVLKLDPNNTDGLFNMGRALIQKSKTTLDNETISSYYDEEGISYVNRVLELDPNHVNAISFKADELVRVGRFSEGITLAEKALMIDQNNVDALYVKASALAQQENYYDSITFFDRVLQNNPEHRLAQINMQASSYRVGTYPFDGFLDVFVHDSDGFLSTHIRITNLKILNHTIAEDLTEGWPVVDIIQRNGTDYELRQLEEDTEIHFVRLKGGASHYGIPYSEDRSTWLIYGNYWMYYVHNGDTITFVYSVFNQV